MDRQVLTVGDDEPVEPPLSDTLDLHTFDPRDIGELVPAWLDACVTAGFTTVRVIHGKGTGTLRRRVEAILSRHPAVAAFEAAKDASAWGATVATLRAR